LSACGSRSANRSTCRENSGVVEIPISGGDGLAIERAKKDGRLRVLLLRRMTGRDDDDDDDDDAPAAASLSELAGDEDDEDEDGASMSVRERCKRFGSARGPPGTDGALVICTGRGFGAVVVEGCLVRRAVVGWAVVGLIRLSFRVLELLPREEKKPPAAFDAAAERGAACDSCDPIVVVEWRALAVDVAPASAG